MNKPHRPRPAQKHGQKTRHQQSPQGNHPQKKEPTERGRTNKRPHRGHSPSEADTRIDAWENREDRRYDGNRRHDGNRRQSQEQGHSDKTTRASGHPAGTASSEDHQVLRQPFEKTSGKTSEKASGLTSEQRFGLTPERTSAQRSKENAGQPAGEAFSHDEENTQIPLLPGVKPVLEMLIDNPERIDMVFIRKGRHGREMDEILDRCRKAGVRFALLEPSAFAKQLGQTQTQGVAARLFESGFTPFESLLDSIMDAPLPLLVALDQVQDPGNAGTLARTLYALGGAGLVIPRHNSVYLGAGAARAAAGALQKLPVAKVGSLSQAIDSARKMGITVYGASAGGSRSSVPVTDLFALNPRFPALLLLGSEEKGIRPTLVKRCHTLVSIPMQRDFDSLNVAQAGAICIAAFLHRHLAKG